MLIIVTNIPVLEQDIDQRQEVLVAVLAVSIAFAASSEAGHIVESVAGITAEQLAGVA